MQRELCRFTHRTNEQQDADRAHQIPRHTRNRRDVVSVASGIGEDRGVIQRPKHHQHQAYTKQKSKVAHAVNQKRFQIGVNRGRPRVPETDQQIRHQPDSFPAEKQLHEIISHHQHQHGKGKQRDVAEEALIAGVFRHIAYCVDVHHQRHKGHHQHHHHRQPVNQKPYFKAGVARGHPLIHGTVESIPRHHILKYRYRSK